MLINIEFFYFISQKIDSVWNIAEVLQKYCYSDENHNYLYQSCNIYY